MVLVFCKLNDLYFSLCNTNSLLSILSSYFNFKTIALHLDQISLKTIKRGLKCSVKITGRMPLLVIQNVKETIKVLVLQLSCAGVCLSLCTLSVKQLHNYIQAVFLTLF